MIGVSLVLAVFLARMLHESGQWNQVLQTAPPVLQDEPDIYF
jgi:hypothetical protein